jgi:hypothetical protein
MFWAASRSRMLPSGDIEVVAQVVRLLADGRLAATGSAEHGKTAAACLQSGSVSTSRGAKTPIQIPDRHRTRYRRPARPHTLSRPRR